MPIEISIFKNHGNFYYLNYVIFNPSGKRKIKINNSYISDYLQLIAITKCLHIGQLLKNNLPRTGFSNKLLVEINHEVEC